MFESNIRNVLYAYGIWQSLFEQMEKKINHITFYQGIPDKEILEQFRETMEILFSCWMMSWLRE